MIIPKVIGNELLTGTTGRIGSIDREITNILAIIGWREDLELRFDSGFIDMTIRCNAFANCQNHQMKNNVLLIEFS